MPLRIFHKSGWRIKPHRLVVKQRSRKSSEVMTLEIGAGIGDESKAGRVRLGKSIQRKRSDRENDLLLRLPRDPVALHALAEVHFDVVHPLLTALEAHRATQLFRLSPGKSGSDHGHAQELLLK